MKKPSFFIFLSILIISVSFFPLFVNKLLQKNRAVEKPSYSAIIELWQIDMIEGGTGSRRDYLIKAAKEFEKKNSGIIISVFSESEKSAREKIARGIIPDLISYSSGLDAAANIAKEIKLNVEGLGGKYQNKLYAVPWAAGGYAYITEKGVKIEECQKLFVSRSAHTLPLAAYYLSSYRFENVEQMSPLDAYIGFRSSKNCALLGTQRDLFRLNTRNIECDLVPIDRFCDLIQYISILTADSTRYKYSLLFIESLLEYSETKLDTIGMLPIKNAINSKNEVLERIKNRKIDLSVNVFCPEETLEELNKEFLDSSITDEKKLNSLKSTVK